MSKAPRSIEPPVHSISSVPEAVGAEQARRTRQYLLQMGIRLVCFIGAVAALTTGHVWLGWALAAGAIVLPYTAVIFVNAPNRRESDAAAYVPHEPKTLGDVDGKPTGNGQQSQGANQVSSNTTHDVIDGDGLVAGVRDEPAAPESPLSEPRENA